MCMITCWIFFYIAQTTKVTNQTDEPPDIRTPEASSRELSSSSSNVCEVVGCHAKVLWVSCDNFMCSVNFLFPYPFGHHSIHFLQCLLFFCAYFVWGVGMVYLLTNNTNFRLSINISLIAFLGVCIFWIGVCLWPLCLALAHTRGGTNPEHLESIDVEFMATYLKGSLSTPLTPIFLCRCQHICCQLLTSHACTVRNSQQSIISSCTFPHLNETDQVLFTVWVYE